MQDKIKHFMYVPFTGLGLYGGFRGNRWLRNRIKVFKQFVIPSLQAQTSQNFTLWISWRREEKNNPYVRELQEYMRSILEFKTIHTFAGVCFYDDKYPDADAKDRLVTSVHASMGDLIDEIGQATHVLMTIQPSDDLYHRTAVEGIQQIFKETELEGVGFSKGYMCNYTTKEIAEYNPTTNPPFYTIKFPKDSFVEPRKHAEFTALKTDEGGYKAGTPCPSHEYIGKCLKYGTIDVRGFLVGTHGENISTTYVHPFKGEIVPPETLREFGIMNVPPLEIKFSLRKRILQKLPHKVQRKLRYIFGEKVWKAWYNFLRS